MMQNPLPELIRRLIDLREDIAQMAESSPERALSLGREYATCESPNYIEADYIFDTLSKSKDKKIKGIALLYDHVLLSLSYPRTRNSKLSDLVVRGLLRCMLVARKMHAGDSLPKEDLFAIDTLVDRAVSEDLLIQDRRTFEKEYCKFKEYVTNVFLDQKKEK